MMGHRAGVERLHDIVAATSDLGIPVLTVYAFSAENWKRPSEEVGGLMKLLVEYLEKELYALAKNGVRITFLGTRNGLSDAVVSAMEKARAKTGGNSKTVLNLAFNYGGRQSIVLAAKRLALLPRKESSIRTPSTKPFRTNAERQRPARPGRGDQNQRGIPAFELSAFETAYSELVFTDAFWPISTSARYLNALAEYQRRSRRFGGCRPANQTGGEASLKTRILSGIGIGLMYLAVFVLGYHGSALRRFCLRHGLATRDDGRDPRQRAGDHGLAGLFMRRAARSRRLVCSAPRPPLSMYVLIISAAFAVRILSKNVTTEALSGLCFRWRTSCPFTA